MTRPENTADRDPLIHTVGLMDGSDRYITEMEAAGQAQLVNSDVLPVDGPWAGLEQLGFTAGEPVPGDSLFRRCTLPEGWRRAGSDHDMWSYIVDQRGVRRVAVFYKAAFYDRSASFSISNVGGNVASDAVYGEGPPALPDCWDVLTDEERASFIQTLDAYLRNAAECPQVYGQRAARARELKKLVQR